MIATSDMVGAYAPPAVHSPDTSALCGQKNELNFTKVDSGGSFVDLELFFSDPDPTFHMVSDPDPVSDPSKVFFCIFIYVLPLNPCLE
jgi:hypothetical protein